MSQKITVIYAVSFHSNHIRSDPPVKVLGSHNRFIDSTSLQNLPLCIIIQMSHVSDVLVTVLKNGHLFDSVSPGIKVYLAALNVERKVPNLYETFRVDPDLGHPSDHASVGYPRVE